MKNLKNKLKKYAGIAAATIGGTTMANADIVHITVDPDSNLTNPLDSFNIDINQDGVDDFQFEMNASGPFFLSTASTYADTVLNDTVARTIWFKNERQNFKGFDGNGVQGNFVSSNFGGFPSPDVLSYGNSIGASSSANWYGGGLFGINFQYDMVWFGKSNGYLGANASFTSAPNGDWASESDKYVGLRIVQGVDTLFGWARVDVSAGYDSLTLKSYGYQDDVLAVGKAGDTTEVTAPTAQNLTLTGVGTALTGADFDFAFDTASGQSGVTLYHVVLVKASNAGFTANDAMAAPATSKIDLAPDSSNHSLSLSAITTDSDGDTIVFGTSYVAYVVSRPDGIESNTRSISAASNEVTITDPTLGVDVDLSANAITMNKFGSTVHIESLGKSTVEVYDLSGRQLTIRSFTNQKDLNLGHVNGLYIVNVSNENGVSRSERFIF